jgi:hypothetical protein
MSKTNYYLVAKRSMMMLTKPVKIFTSLEAAKKYCETHNNHFIMKQTGEGNLEVVS